MGTYSTSEWRELFGGDPEPGEAYLPLDAIDHLRKAQRESNLSRGGLIPPVPVSSRGRTTCGACGAGPDDECASACEANRA